MPSQFRENVRRPEPATEFGDRIVHFLKSGGVSSEVKDLFEVVIKSVDVDRHARLLEKYRYMADKFVLNTSGEDKYLDICFWVYQKCHLAIQLGLHKKPPMNILDLGCGAGHFGHVCRALGHDYIGLDVENQLYADLCDMFGLRRIVHRIVSGQPLPRFAQHFDLVSAVDICYDYVGLDPATKANLYWNLEDWTWFLASLKHEVKLSGSLYFQLNPHLTPGGEWVYSPMVIALFRAMGATFLHYDSRILMPVTDLYRVPSDLHAMAG